ncbi:MAG: efflux RND transporter periplasmic adaptor subunit [Rubellimicrobium sp.]|nr:efflux RND transporter periplasmic adaptor subunit [Rubellimicrobium sp.]
MAIGIVVAAGSGLLLYFQPWDAGPVPVAIEIAAPAPVTRVLAVNGRIAARHSVDVRALVGGAVTDVRVEEGDIVDMDAVLVRLDSAAQQAQLRQALAGLDTALVAQEQALDAQARTRALGATVAQAAVDDAERAVRTAAQEVARATAVLDQAQVQLDAYTIRAPMTGTVLVVSAEPGQNVDPSSVLMTVADLGQLVVETDVDEAYAVQVRAGQPVVLQLTGEDTLREGQVSRVSQRVDAATGGLAVVIEFDTPVTAPVGLTVAANIIVEAREAAFTAPRSAIRAEDAGHAVFVVVDDLAQRRAVSVIDWPAARLIVTDGLEAGDRVILDATLVDDGRAVRPRLP